MTIARTYAIEAPAKDKNANTFAIEHYLSQVGMPLAMRAHRRLPYRFHYIPNEFMINAFALARRSRLCGRWTAGNDG